MKAPVPSIQKESCSVPPEALFAPDEPPDDEESLQNECCKPDNIKSSKPCSGKEAWKTQKENGFPKENQTPTTVSSVR